MTDLLRTPLCQKHIDLGAKMVPFAGWYMPVSYSGIIDEHQTVRKAVGIFDVSHMGEFLLSGPDSEKFLNYVTVGNFGTVKQGKARYTILCDERGGVIDDIICYRLGADDFMICVNASNIEKDFVHLFMYAQKFDVDLKNVSNDTALIALQGPNSIAVARALFGDAVANLRPFSVGFCDFDDEAIIVASTGYTGEKGFELFITANKAEALWDALIAFKDEAGLKPIGLGARDTLRLEKKYPLYGNDLDETISPVEAGLTRFIDDTKEEYIGKARIHKEMTEGPARSWVGLFIDDKRIPRHGAVVFCPEERVEVGVVSSGTFSPSLEKPIATAYVRHELAIEGTKLLVDVRGTMIAATVTTAPFL